jgi:hypothetical protein
VPTVYENNRMQEMRDLEKQGISRTEIGSRFNLSRQRVSQILGTTPYRGQRREHVVNVLDPYWDRAMHRAKDLGMFVRFGPTAGEGSISLLIERIGAGRLSVLPTKELQKLRDETLHIEYDYGEHAFVNNHGPEWLRDREVVVNGFSARGNEVEGVIVHYDVTPVDKDPLHDERGFAFVSGEYLTRVKRNGRKKKE